MEETDDFPRTLHRKRDGRCYEIAGIALLGLKDDTAWRLVHGLKKDETLGLRFGHAWLTNGALVWDPVKAKAYPASDYMARAEALGTSTRADLCRHVAAGDVWGPWLDIPQIAP